MSDNDTGISLCRIDLLSVIATKRNLRTTELENENLNVGYVALSGLSIVAR